MIARAIERSSGLRNKEMAEMDTLSSEKAVKFTVRGQRNNMVHEYVPFLLKYIDRPTTSVEMQVIIIEALGWHALSYQTPLIAERTLAISKDEKYDPAVRAEALKTYNRLHAR